MRAYEEERDDFKKHYSLGDKYWCVVCNICTPNYCDIGLLNRNNRGKLGKKRRLRKVQMPKIKRKIALELLTDFLPCGTHLLGHWNKSLKALLWSHSCEGKIVIFYLWTTVCVLIIRASNPSVQRGPAATWGYNRKLGPVTDVGTHSISCLLDPASPCLCSRHLGIAWGITDTSKFTPNPACYMKRLSQPSSKKSQGQRNVWSHPPAQG